MKKILDGKLLVMVLVLVLMVLLVVGFVWPLQVVGQCEANRKMVVTVAGPAGRYTMVSAYDGGHRVDFEIGEGGVAQVATGMVGWVILLDRDAAGVVIDDVVVGWGYVEAEAEMCGMWPTWKCPPNLPPGLDCPHGGE